MAIPAARPNHGYAVGLQRPRGLTQAGGKVAPVMRAAAAQHHAEGRVIERQTLGGAHTFEHPPDGFLRCEPVTFTLANRPDLKLTPLLKSAG